MPDFSRIKQIRGILYCWDKLTKKFIRVNLTDIDIKDVPLDVLRAFIEDGDDVGSNNA